MGCLSISGCGAAGTARGDLSVLHVLEEQLLPFSGSWLRGRWDLYPLLFPRGCSAAPVGFLVSEVFIV